MLGPMTLSLNDPSPFRRLEIGLIHSANMDHVNRVRRLLHSPNHAAPLHQEERREPAEDVVPSAATAPGEDQIHSNEKHAPP